MEELAIREMQRVVKDFIEKEGFEWSRLIQFTHLVEEVGEVGEALAVMEGERKAGSGESGLADHSDIEEEIGDVMFSLSALANKCNVDMELAFDKTIKRYKKKASRRDQNMQSSG